MCRCYVELNISVATQTAGVRMLVSGRVLRYAASTHQPSTINHQLTSLPVGFRTKGFLNVN